MPRTYRKKRTNKRTTRKRTVTRKRRTTAKSRAKFVKKVQRISQERKVDHLPGAIMPAMGTDPSIVFQQDFQLDGTIKCYGWTPSFHMGTDRKGDHVRNKSTIQQTGVSERYNIGSHSGVPIIHRRIVFSVTVNLPDFELHDGDGPLRRFRKMDQISVADWWFQGTRGMDWIDPMKAQLDRHSLNVIYDRKVIIKPYNDYGTEITRNHWIPFKRKVMFDDKEQFDSTDWKEWPSANSHKLYIVDMLQSTADTSGEPSGTHFGTFESNATHYWRES
ncbi:capsid protein [Finch associated genomovirus 8]|uniref:Capsid protein n=1 Tax=Finch associated genomovirus 8 TaxID=2576460 RepID=A0A4P8PL41_9VIRU|nr:capsid protein [Finch associated genomovirus 8]QCQ85169.1 capsid protein [Finch associated genomovirus 8]QCQ85201.1 capsid protein [Finch associated genomovirus 8]